MNKILSALCLVLLLAINTVTLNAAPWFGLTPPGTNPVVFAPGILSLSSRYEGRIAFSPDGRECYFTVLTSDYSVARLYSTTQDTSGLWSAQTQVSFLPTLQKFEPWFSFDGEHLYFTAKTNNQTDFYVMDRTPQGWTAPTPLPAPINSSANEFNLCQAADGTYCFASARAGGFGDLDIYRTRKSANQTLLVENLGSTINSSASDGDPCIAPDQRFIVFYSTRSGYGGSDLFVSFNNRKGGWTSPVNLGSRFNNSADEFGATISPDGQYLFYVRQQYGGTVGDVYWVSVAAIDNLNPLPVIRTHPVSQTASPDDTITFHATASGAAPLRYQWLCNETNRLTAATNNTLSLTNVQLCNVGSYSMVVTNTYGSITSNPALLLAEPTLVKLLTPAPGKLSFQSWIAIPFTLECSSDLLHWTPLGILTNLTGALQFTNLETTPYSQLFYRAHLP